MLCWTKPKYPGNDPENGPARCVPVYYVNDEKQFEGCVRCGDTECDWYTSFGVCGQCVELEEHRDSE